MFGKKKHPSLTDSFGYLSQGLDSIGVTLAGMICYFIYSKKFEIPYPYLVALIINTLLVFTIFPKYDLYCSWRGRSKWKRTKTLIYAWLTTVAALVVISISLKNSTYYSRIWFFSWIIFSFFYLIGYRTLFDHILNNLRRKGINRKKILVYGAGEVGKNICHSLNDNQEFGFEIIGFIDDNRDIIGNKINNIVIHSPEKLISLLDDHTELWIALPLRAEKKVSEILHQTRHITSVIRYIPDIFNFRLLNHSITQIADIPIIELNGAALSAPNRFLKRMEDIILSSLIILPIFPICLVIAFLIKITSKGPVIYKQERHGWNGKPMKIYKFRSMYFCEKNPFKQAIKNDSRLTIIGKFIRKTSLDELPQFINVLQGKMSIVGPRPHPIALNDDYKDKINNLMQRHKVKPGITGWAQINGFRGETDTLDKMVKRIEYDLFYIQNWSLWIDLKIIFLTILKGFVGKNVY